MRKFEFFFISLFFSLICCNCVFIFFIFYLFHFHLLEVFRVIGILDSKERSSLSLQSVKSDWHTSGGKGVCSIFTD
ncbi:unnamed protein product [Victoria cruziana]